MGVITKASTKKQEIIDITKEIKDIVSESSIKQGFCLVYTPHATCAVIINENYDPNVTQDILKSLNNLVPEGKWLHDKVDNNGAAHIKAAILGPSEIIPIINGKLALGQWQNCMLADFDGPKQRNIFVEIK